MPVWLRTDAAVSRPLSSVVLLAPRTRAIGAVGVFTPGNNMLWAPLYCGGLALAAARASPAWDSRHREPTRGA